MANKILSFLTAFCLALALTLSVSAREFRAQPFADQCATGKPASDDLIRDWTIRCINEISSRLVALENAVPGIAWQKADDRLHLFKTESAAYKDRWFYDEVWKRFQVHMCRSGVETNNLVRC